MIDNTPKYTMAEVAEKLGISHELVRKWARKKQVGKGRQGVGMPPGYVFSEFRMKQIEAELGHKVDKESMNQVILRMKKEASRQHRERYKITFGKPTKEKPKHEE